MNEDLFHGLHHISMIASSVHTLEFYEKLGFREVHAIKDSHQHLIVMKGHGLTLEFLIDEDHPKKEGNLGTRGVRCFALKAKNFDRVCQLLPCGPVRTNWLGKRYCSVRDIDGQIVEIHE